MAYTTIDKPTDYFSVNLWVADDSSPRSLTGFGHQPDLVWTKHRGSGSINPTITDSVRGGDKQLATATTGAEDSGSHGKISAFGTDGITVIDGTSGSYPKLYFNDLNPFGASVGGNYVGWSWKASGSTSSNTDGSITSTVSANTTAGFSIVSYTGTGANATVGHGLGVAPKMIIARSRSNGGDGWHWRVYHASIGATKYLGLNQTIASTTSSTFWNDTEPTSSVFSLGTDGVVNLSSGTFIAYCFAEKKGYSKFGSYVGNGSSDGSYIHLGFKPAFVITKSSSNISNWDIMDNKRQTFNDDQIPYLYANATNAEITSVNNMDFLSNGFKLRVNDDEFNGSGRTYIYMAFAENPFVTSTGIPSCAR